MRVVGEAGSIARFIGCIFCLCSVSVCVCVTVSVSQSVCVCTLRRSSECVSAACAIVAAVSLELTGSGSGRMGGGSLQQRGYKEKSFKCINPTLRQAVQPRGTPPLSLFSFFLLGSIYPRHQGQQAKDHLSRLCGAIRMVRATFQSSLLSFPPLSSCLAALLR